MVIREREAPEPGPGEALIRVEQAGICGSELSGYLGHNSLRKPPLIMGHEFAGTVHKLGAGVTRFQPGDRVTANPLITCGRCRNCTNGASQLCANRKLIGAHCQGAFAEYVAVPETNLYLLGDRVSFDEGAFTEPLACAVHIARLLKPLPTQRLLIMGAGPIGLLTLRVAQIHGLTNIAVIDINEERLSIAAELGAITAASLEALAHGGIGSFDAAIDAVGLESTRTQCVEALKPGGIVVFSGLHADASKLPINDMIRSEIRCQGAFAYHSDDFETAWQWIGEGRIRLSPWTIHAPLEQGGEAFERLIAGSGKIAKILLTVH
ncbi:galactitol-1-phosphate 5-dehydrogenase [Paenibacillus piri]|uniref:Galactitol-1-phosphate 5-dehydrogenase n=2 Tax=Paenibacillus piri TaxID=2547395 RepID=A0A4V2ZU89_9BACL|nr:galactitol-1-phosphate 5-dehydrogenase [Paenibacillus piri]